MTNVLRSDIFLNALLGFMALVILLLQLISPTKEANDPPPGSLSIYAAWPEGPTDVDLWVHAPGEEFPVGFSAKTGQMLSLLRDDLGTSNDPLPANFENVYSRGLPEGEYVINLHCFNCPTLPVEVTVEVRVARPGANSTVLLSTKVTLRKKREEVTVVRFKLDDAGMLVRGSMHSVFKPLYTAQEANP